MDSEESENRINRAKFAGRWYPAQPKRLAADLQRYLAEATPHTPSPRGAILPHAGLSFSGPGMAEAFRNVDTAGVWQIVILSPSHYVRLAPNMIHYGDFESHETPLGHIAGAPGFWNGGEVSEPNIETGGPAGPPTPLAEANRAVEMEHGLELFFPFVRHLFGEDVRVAAALIPEISALPALKPMADTLLERIEAGSGIERTLLVISSDFTHYGPGFGYAPFGIGPLQEVEARVAEDDREVAELAAECDPQGLLRRYADRDITVCGRYPILLGAELFRRLSYRGRLTNYYNSNSFGGSRREFVCYASVLYGPEERV